MLFRAVAYAVNSPQDWPEVHVFFEADNYNLALGGLRNLLEELWGREADFYNVVSEAELVQYAQQPATKDWVLFECGSADGLTLYCAPERTLLLVSPPMHARLMKVVRALPPLSPDGWPLLQFPQKPPVCSQGEQA